MQEPKTKPNDASVEAFLDSISDPQQQADCRQLTDIMRSITGQPAVMWGTAIVGFGNQHYKYATGREGDTMAVGFAPRKQAITIYGLVYYDKNRQAAAKLGSVKMGKGCLYIKRLAEVDLPTLKELIKKSFAENQS